MHGPLGLGQDDFFQCRWRPDQTDVREGVYIDEIDIAPKTFFRRRRTSVAAAVVRSVYIFQICTNIVKADAATGERHPHECSSRGCAPDEAQDRAVRYSFKRVGLGERSAAHLQGTLRGASSKRLAIARASPTSLAIILGDEPTANLDLLARVRKFHRPS